MENPSPDSRPPDSDLKLIWEIRKLEAEVRALRRPFTNPATLIAIIVAAVTSGGLMLQWTRSGNEYTLAQIKTERLQLQSERLEQQAKTQEVVTSKLRSEATKLAANAKGLEAKAALLRQQRTELEKERAALVVELATRHQELLSIKTQISGAADRLRKAGVSNANITAAENSLGDANSRLAAMVAGSIIATPDTISTGEFAELRWNSFDATSVIITPGIGAVPPSGRRKVAPLQTTTYTMTLSNDAGGFGTGSATVYVQGSASRPLLQ